MKTKSILTFLSLAAVIFLNSCDPHTPPAIHFKTGGDYISTDISVAPNTSVLVGITAKKREDDMKRYNISRSIDGGSSQTVQNFSLSGSDQRNYDKDFYCEVGPNLGVQKWSFVITDRDGNIAKLSLTINVINP